MTAERLIDALQQAENRLTTVRGSSTDAIDTFNAYIKWSNDEVSLLGGCVSPASLDLLLTTPRYWMLQGLDPGTKGSMLASLVQLEIEQRLRAFEAARTAIGVEAARYASADLIVVPDTNVFLHGPARFDLLPWERLATQAAPCVLIVVPLVVVDELDRAKRRTDKVVPEGKEQVRDRARTTLRALAELVDDPRRPAVLRSAPTPGGPSVTLLLRLETPGHVRLPDADSEIVDQARVVLDLSGRPTAIVTSDMGMKLRASAVDLAAVDVPTNEEARS
ncbi:MAG: hypothetical protein HGA44_01625 [Cellulomonadaceae bacterium]|nr:hypothetical protein [Cellulomonadaceae bacterium]